MLQNLRITTKYPVVIVTLALLASVITGLVAYNTTSVELQKSAGGNLSALLETRKKALENYFSLISEDLRVQTQNPIVTEALERFSYAWHMIESDRQVYFQEMYILKNPYPEGQKKKLDKANDLSSYSSVHEKFHPIFRKLQQERGYYDIFLFDKHGDLIYTVIKEKDFATNFNDGPWKQTNLGRAFRAARDLEVATDQVILDFEAYEPSNKIPASFIASSLYDNSENFIGVLAFQLPIDRLNDVMQVDAGMGKTGEAFIVGSDLLRRSDSRFSVDSLILQEVVDRESVHRALQGESGITSFVNAGGESIYTVFEPFTFKGIRWALVAEIDELEILAPIQRMKQTMVAGFITIAIAVTFIGLFISQSLSRPIIRMTDAMTRLSEMDFSIEVSTSHRQDEIGGMERALMIFRDNAIARSKADAKLIEQSLLLKVVMENVAHGLALYDKDARLLIWNNRYIENKGLGLAELKKGDRFLELAIRLANKGVYGKGDPEELAKARLDFLTQNENTRIELVINQDDIYEVMSQKTPDGGFVVAYSDVTLDRKNRKEILRQRDDLHNLNQQKNRFFSIIAHDLRSPFNALLGYSEILKQKAATMSPDQITEYASSIHLASQQTYELLENLLEWSRVQMNKIEFEPQDIQINDVLKSVVGDLTSVIRDKELQVVVRPDALQVVGDRNMTATIVRNLIGNAIKFTHRGGSIEITSKRVDGFVHIQVQDNGVGMKPKAQAELFSLEKNQSTMGTDGEEGTGLGLLICKEFAKKQKGKILVESQEGAGTTITLVLPSVPEGYV